MHSGNQVMYRGNRFPKKLLMLSLVEAIHNMILYLCLLMIRQNDVVDENEGEDSSKTKIGHLISERGIQVDRAKIKVIEKLPPPVNVKEVRSFLGHVGFYRKFIKNFSKIVKPLTQLLLKDATFDFTDAYVESFDRIKEALITTPIIQPLYWSLTFEIMCDASEYAVGVVLGQGKNKVLYAICYASRTLDESHVNYATTKKELLAIFYALDNFMTYLSSKVIVHTDCNTP